MKIPLSIHVAHFVFIGIGGAIVLLGYGIAKIALVLSIVPEIIVGVLGIGCAIGGFILAIRTIASYIAVLNRPAVAAPVIEENKTEKVKQWKQPTKKKTRKTK